MGRGLGCSCRFRGDRDLAVTMRWMKAPTGDTKNEGEKRGEYIVTEAKRVKFHRRGQEQAVKHGRETLREVESPLVW